VFASAGVVSIRRRREVYQFRYDCQLPSANLPPGWSKQVVERQPERFGDQGRGVDPRAPFTSHCAADRHGREAGEASQISLREISLPHGRPQVFGESFGHLVVRAS